MLSESGGDPPSTQRILRSQMKRRRTTQLTATIVLGAVFVLSLGANLGLFFANPLKRSKPLGRIVSEADGHDRNADEELAYLLVKLELATRREIGSHFTRHQSPVPGVDKLYQRLLVKNMILPAAVAGAVFAETVPNATQGRAWVRMVVDDPRNPNNRGDEVALELLAELRAGAETTERNSHDAYYYAEPIKAKAACMYCHGEPKGAPDPYFPQYEKDGWRDGEIIGAVVSRVVSQRDPRTNGTIER